MDKSVNVGNEAVGQAVDKKMKLEGGRRALYWALILANSKQLRLR